MKKIILTLFFIFFTFTSYASLSNSDDSANKSFTGPFTLESQIDQQALSLTISTITIHTTSCVPDVTSLKLQLPGPGHRGRIEITTDDLRDAFCINRVGTHAITVELSRGDALPAIPNGEYELYINGEFV
ncbi:MAG: hypothetical protein HN623_03050, partial [Bdellovibrionales bacterium]|nr:hypothetical protein [Bdellovibrionales bacterium]